MNQFMIGLVLVFIIIILVALLGALNRMYPENFFRTCKSNASSNQYLGSCECPLYIRTVKKILLVINIVLIVIVKILKIF